MLVLSSSYHPADHVTNGGHQQPVPGVTAVMEHRGLITNVALLLQPIGEQYYATRTHQPIGEQHHVTWRHQPTAELGMVRCPGPVFN